MFLVRLIDVFVGVLEFIFKPERRNGGASPAVLGTAGIFVLVMLLVAAIGIPQLTYQSSTSPYTAELHNAGGLTTADPVLVAGVPAGRIESIELAGDHVRVGFRLDNQQPLGNQTRSDVRLRTVLGKRYLEIIPAGSGSVGPDNTIPLSRTGTSYTLDDLSGDAVTTSDEIDPQVMRSLMSTMSSLVPNPDRLSASMDGISGAAMAVTGSGKQLDQLLGMAKRLSEVSAKQADSIATAFGNAQSVAQMLVIRRHILTRLADNLRLVLRTMATTFPQVPMAQLTENIVAVTNTLAGNAEQIDKILTVLPPAMRTVTDATGNGNWADVNSPSAILPDSLLCVLGVMKGCS
ncbi:MlaD family protein [Gordonia sp. (in: high G+C Gram-positive bacteria)]|uniref:MlaD family protein n=1 Tax=Gordonia sp. (in: high G+C Gram-positive bacteria) TaxID=84139 RepID=UPI00169ED330|nr:MlaD family protein [Gordonia sp. (in: high G+C Gram-positive bacteria)]NLG48063.1 MCE family protein [Gordonia sp. (in: high G+C Gram-positive bacteria)]